MSETLTIILSVVGVNVALIGVFTGIVIWLVNKLDADVNKAVSRLDGHANRIDNLYKLFVETQKVNDQKFYDLLREGKK